MNQGSGAGTSQPDRKTVEKLQEITPEILDAYLRSRGWTLQETLMDRGVVPEGSTTMSAPQGGAKPGTDVWSKWYEDKQSGDDVMEILAPTVENTGMKPSWTANARAIGELAFMEDRNPNEIIQEVLKQHRDREEAKSRETALFIREKNLHSVVTPQEIIQLDLEFRREEEEWLGEAPQLGVATAACETAEEAREQLVEMTELFLNGNEDLQQLDEMLAKMRSPYSQ